MAHRTHRFQLRRALLATPVGVGALALAAIAPASAGATGSYPGETLSLKQTGPATVGPVSSFEAFGQQTESETDAGGFALQVFYKPPSVDPTCGASYGEENNTWGADLANELHPVVGDWQGSGTTFSVPFKIEFDKPGAELICAYSTWSFDTAASAQLTVQVAGAPGTSTTPTPTSTSTSAPLRPSDTTKPRVSRSGTKLMCSPGTWASSPTSYSYSWLSNGHALAGAHAHALSVSHKLHGHRVQCSVTASNAVGRTTAISSPYRVH